MLNGISHEFKTTAHKNKDEKKQYTVLKVANPNGLPFKNFKLYVPKDAISTIPSKIDQDRAMTLLKCAFEQAVIVVRSDFKKSEFHYMELNCFTPLYAQAKAPSPSSSASSVPSSSPASSQSKSAEDDSYCGFRRGFFE